MDKLEPLIRNRFWILFGIALPLALAGYFMTSGSMKAATETKEQALQKTLDGVPKGDAEPNQTYADGLKAINEQLKAENGVEVQKLWEGQKARMTWPTILVENNYIPHEFRGEIKDDARRYYTRVYPEAIKEVWERVQPVVDDPPPPGLEVTWPRKVFLLPETIPLHSFEANATPTSKQIWDAQEDIWLLGLLFDSVARANQDAAGIVDAPVRRIDTLTLTGGSGQSSVMASAAGAGGGMDDFGMAGMGIPDDESGRGGVAAMMNAGGRRGPGNSASVGFDVTEEFGPPLPDPESAQAQAAGGGMSDEFGMDGGMGGGMMGMMGMGIPDDDLGGGLGMGGRAGAQNAYRYIGDPSAVAAAPYRERGFYMSAIVMLPQIPSFFAEISSSDWPIRVLRYHIGPNPYRDQTGTRSSFGSGGRLGGRMGGGIMDDDGGSGFGFGGGGRGSRLGGGMLGGGFGGSSRFGGGMGASAIQLPMNMQGPSEQDPNWFAHPDLVQVDFCGIITMYNPQTSDELVPTADGSSSAETEEAIQEDEKARAAAAEAAANEPVEETPAGDQPADQPAPSEEPVPADGAATPSEPAATDPATTPLDSEPTEGTEPSPETTTEPDPTTE